MAASAPPHHLVAGWTDNSNNSAGGNVDDNNAAKDNHNLGLKMSELSLMSNYNHSGPPGMSGSTVSTSSVDDRPLHPHDSSIDHSSAAGSFKGSTPSSPNAEVIGGLSRPPGLLGGGGGHHNNNVNVASPIVGGVPGHHSKNSSATSPMLTLTPNSSVDGNSDLYSRGDHSGVGGPTMPFLRNDGPRGDSNNGDYGGGVGGLTNFGSFDLVDNSDNDGLLGLDALRDRAYSSPGPMARSFESAPSLRGGLPPSRGAGGASDAGLEGRRRRGVSRDNSGRSSSSARPPLSGSGGNNNSSHSPRSGGELGMATTGAGDISLGGLVVPFPPDGRSGDPSPTRQTQQQTQQKPSEYLGLGAIGRPEFSGNAQEWEPSNRRRSIAGTEPNVVPRPDYRYGNEQQPEYEPSRRRSIGTESGREFYPQHQPQQQQQQQQQQQHFGGKQQHHHDGGYGHNDHGQQQQYADQGISHKFGGLPSMHSHMQQQKRMSSQQQQQGQGHHQQPYNPMMIPQPKHQRSYSQPGPQRNAATPPEHLGMEGGSVGRYPPSGLEDNHSGHYPRDPPRYVGGPPPQQGHHVRQHSGDSFRSSHSRRSASMSHGSLSANSYDGSGMPAQKQNSQPNLGGGGYYGQQALPNMHPSMQRMDKADPYDQHAHNRRHTYEDDLTLLGEHIEVPADHVIDDGFSGGYGGGGGGGGGYTGRMRPQMAPPEAMAPHYSGYEGQQIHHLPTAGAALPAPKVVFNVKFKRTQKSFVLGPRIQRDLKVGTYVKVEADRGEDLGIVIGKVPAEKLFSGRNAFRSQINDMMPTPTSLSPPGATDLKCIMRLATHDEVSLLAMKRDEEEELLTICRTKVRQRALPMNVVDAEYQFDRHKLTFFFEAEGRIDFRELVRDLFSMYKTRIWMQQLDKNNCSTAGGTGQPVPVTSMIDYGTPIMAPESEFGGYGLPGGN